MVDWKSLGDICEIKGRIGFRGYTRDDQVDKGEGAISLSPGNINDGVVNYDSCTYITWNKYEESPEIMVSEGDIILCKTASVGKVARIHSLPEKATINPQLVLIKNIKTDPQFLLYVLSDSPFQSKLKGLAGVGSVPNVSQAKLASIQIPIPCLPEQKRIVEQLDTFTSSIENLKEQIAQRRKQYEYYRDQLLDLEGKEGVEMKHISDVAKSFTGLTYKPENVSEEGTLVLRSSNIDEDVLAFDDNVFVQMVIPDRAIVKENDILICVRNGSKRLVGKAAIITKKAKGMAFGAFMTILRSFGIDSKFLFYVWQSKKVKKQYKGDKAMPIAQITAKDFQRILIPVPSLSEQQRIVSILDTFEASIRNLEQQLAQREKQYEYYRNKLLTFE